MRSSLIKEVSQKGLNTYLKERQHEAMYWAAFFPIKNVISLSYTTLIGETGGRVAADVISYDASAPLKTRKVIGKLAGDIPKIAIKRKMTETDFQDYLYLSRIADADQKQLLDLIYDDIDFVTQGVFARMEWLTLQALSRTAITLSAANNNGIVTEESIDFKMPDTNKFGATVAWNAADKATTKPITDIKAIVKAARKVGHRLTHMLMDQDRIDDFMLSTEVQTYLKSYFKLEGSDVLPFENIALINKALASAKLPIIVGIDQSIDIEGKDGNKIAVNPWDNRFVTFVSSLKMGNMLNGPIVEEIVKPKDVIQAKAGNILVSKYSTTDPVAEFTKGEASAFPSWPTVDKAYSLKATATTWAL